MSTPDNKSLSQEVAHGTKWYMAMRWSIKSLGFISSAVLARLLVPEDFGLVATVMVVLGFVSLLFEFGVNWALIQNNKASDEHFNTAWTIRIIQAIIIAALIAVFAPQIAQAYGDTRIEEICLIIALATFIQGFENIGTVKFQKEMNFSKDFSYNVTPKIIATIITIGLAFYYQSYYALVVASLLNSLIKVVISYSIIDYRPRLTLTKFSDIWGFSQWILIRNIANYISTQGDIIVLSALATPTNIGYYKWSSELSFIAISEVQLPFSRALLPGLAKIKDNHQQLIAAYLKALSFMAIISVPVALGFGAVSHELIPLFLGGDKWLPVVPLVEALVFFAMCTALYGISGNLLTINGNVKYTAYIFWCQAIITILSLYPAYSAFGLLGIAYTRALIGVIMFFLVSILVTRLCDVSFKQIINAIWRPVFSGLLMYAIVINISDIFNLSTGLLLLFKLALGVSLYSLFILALWGLSRDKHAIETSLIESTRRYVANIRVRKQV
ncbi:MAG: lipopolysaccharide biosynthesis protein [Gammaproteobacteria bacterium]|nr:lipopolysaccharide biosynthesis protein [Gammaproteobacteria bacterium]